MTVVKEGRRHYISGDTYAIRGQLKAAGCHWDPERRAWWTSKPDVAERFARGQDAQPAAQKHGRKLGDDTKLVGKCRYKGRTYYAMFLGMTSRGTEAAHLVSFDGSVDFWKDLAEVEVVKTYGREWRGRVEYPTLGSMRRFIQTRAKHDPEGVGRDLEEGYYMHNGEVLASGCSECRCLGHMCPQCRHDYE